MYNIMTKLIFKRYYKNKDEAQNKVDVFYAIGRLTDDEYSELNVLIEKVYIEGIE